MTDFLHTWEIAFCFGVLGNEPLRAKDVEDENIVWYGKSEKYGVEIKWHSTPDTLPMEDGDFNNDVPIMFFANEFFDALPVRIFTFSYVFLLLTFAHEEKHFQTFSKVF